MGSPVPDNTVYSHSVSEYYHYSLDLFPATQISDGDVYVI